MSTPSRPESAKSPREVIAHWLWTEADAIDFDDMGDQAGQNILDALNKAGWKVVPLRGDSQ